MDQMLFPDSLVTSEVLEEFTIKFFIPFISFLILSIIGPAAITYNKKIDKKEKNQYLKVLKTNYYIKQTFIKFDYLNDHMNGFLFLISMGMVVGVIYFFIALYVVAFVYALILQFDFSSHQILFLGIEPNSETNKQLIFITYLSVMLLPLIIITWLLFYLIDCRKKEYITKPSIIKRKRLGKMIQILKRNFYNLAEKTKPNFNNEMRLTIKSKASFCLFPILIGMFLMVNVLVYSSTFSVLSTMIGQPFTFSLEHLHNLYLSMKTVLSDRWIYLACVYYFIILFFSILFSILLYVSALAFLNEGKEEIIKYYSEGYPDVCIKVSSGELNGKVEDVFNKHLIVLNKEGVKKLTSWNNIEIIEIKTNDE